MSRRSERRMEAARSPWPSIEAQNADSRRRYEERQAAEQVERQERLDRTTAKVAGDAARLLAMTADEHLAAAAEYAAGGLNTAAQWHATMAAAKVGR